MPWDHRGGTVEEVRRLNVLIDVNVLLDVLLDRAPWVDQARKIWTAHHRRALEDTSPLTLFRTSSTSPARSSGSRRHETQCTYASRHSRSPPSVVLNWNWPTRYRGVISRIIWFRRVLPSPASTPSSPATRRALPALPSPSLPLTNSWQGFRRAGRLDPARSVRVVLQNKCIPFSQVWPGWATWCCPA